MLEEEVAADAGVELPPRALKIRATMATRSVRLGSHPAPAQHSHFCESTSKAGFTQAQQQRMMQQLMPVLTAQESGVQREREAVLACVALFSEEQVLRPSDEPDAQS